ncbi:LAME_0D01706g1_1 [Lachancea meyersii CBS 8951]|uniref:LAME_0D01706g1_1 n=1 Tax=Lachancea meyersii CBS 8951 TaxID=1266667 RepID=A0A1G4J6M7_9SACH|nr:LAME_0D01706g1_1 [Lachancea meyersii CBS 8951]
MSEQRHLLLLHPAVTVTPEKVEDVKKNTVLSECGILDQFLINKLNDGTVKVEDGTYDVVYYLTPEKIEEIQFPAKLIPVLTQSLKVGGKLYGLSDAYKVQALINGLEIVSRGENYHWVKKSNSHNATAPVALNLRAPSKPTNLDGPSGSISKKLRALPTFKKLSPQAASKPLPTFKRPESPKFADEVDEDDSEQQDDESDQDSDELTAAKSKFFDNVEGDDSAESIDENELVNEDEKNVITVVTCGKTKTRRRKACKDCTCGLKEQEEQAMDAARAAQDSVLGQEVKFDEQELSEIDFTIQGKKVGGCGSCALGDAFRCSGCPYLGLPAFKPGQPISLDSIADDL